MSKRLFHPIFFFLIQTCSSPALTRGTDQKGDHKIYGMSFLTVSFLLTLLEMAEDKTLSLRSTAKTDHSTTGMKKEAVAYLIIFCLPIL